MTTTFETYRTRLQSRGLLTEQVEAPRLLRDPIQVTCQQGHQWTWDLKHIIKRLDDPHAQQYPNLCPRCIDEYIRTTDATQLCQRLGVGLVSISDDRSSYTYQLPCGHHQTTEKKTLQKFDHTPYCLECLRIHRENNPEPENVIIDRFANKLNRIKRKNRAFSEDEVDDILTYVNRRFMDLNIGMHQTGYDEGMKDIFVYMKCEGYDYCHRNTTSLRHILTLLKCVHNGKLYSPCPDCHNMRKNLEI